MSSSEPIVLSNYDIIVDGYSKPKSIQGEGIDIEKEGEKEMAEAYYLNTQYNHVGNHRLEVLLNINRKAFFDCQEKGDESGANSVIDKVIDIVCNQCVPKGRFLSNSNRTRDRKNDCYEELSDTIVRAVIRKAFVNIDNTANQLPKMPSTPMPMSASDASNDTNNDDSDSEAPSPAFPMANDTSKDDFERKRRRRSSLLRRSVSESQLAGFLVGDKKKVLCQIMDSDDDESTSDISSDGDKNDTAPVMTANAGERSSTLPQQLPTNQPISVPKLHHEPGQQPSRPRRKRSVIKASEVNNLDIVFNMSQNKLVINNNKYFGNNRLRVLISLQIQAFISYEFEQVPDNDNDDDDTQPERISSSSTNTASSNNSKPTKTKTIKTVKLTKPKDEELAKIINDIIGAVEKSWGGRFLAESLLEYTKLDHEETFAALKKVIIEQLAASAATSENDNTEDGENSHSNTGMDLINVLDSENEDGDDNASNTRFFRSDPKRPSQIKQAALMAISDGINLDDDDDMVNLRSEAVKSLQKRKAKQKLNNRIRGLTSTAVAAGAVVPGSTPVSRSNTPDVGLQMSLQRMDLNKNWDK